MDLSIFFKPSLLRALGGVFRTPVGSQALKVANISPKMPEMTQKYCGSYSVYGPSPFYIDLKPLYFHEMDLIEVSRSQECVCWSPSMHFLTKTIQI